MKWTKLNTTFDADPNGPEPRASCHGSVVLVQFYLNYFIWPDVKENGEAVLVFRDVYMYRLGSTNDEGFYRGQCRFSGSGIAWGNFHEPHDSNWKDLFPADRIIVESPFADEPSLKHFLFYFHDETFECIARSFEFQRL